MRMYHWLATSSPVAVQMTKMMVNCRAHFRAVSTALDFLISGPIHGLVNSLYPAYT